jgi:hypothetical protein
VIVDRSGGEKMGGVGSEMRSAIAIAIESFCIVLVFYKDVNEDYIVLQYFIV